MRPLAVGVLGEFQQFECELAGLAGEQRDPDGAGLSVVAVGENHRDVLQPAAVFEWVRLLGVEQHADV
jgi:hypothetical protein